MSSAARRHFCRCDTAGAANIGFVTHAQVDMTTAPARPPSPPFVRRHAGSTTALLLGGLLVLFAGCSQPEPVVTYSVPTKLPEQLQAGKSRMLAVMFPKGDDVWFFKLTGPEKAMAEIETPFRQFVEEIEFTDAIPNLSELPSGWRRGSDKPFRFATINIDTPMKQLDLSVSKLQRQDDWDTQVQSNVNRWRGQLGLKASDDKWAEGEALEVSAADADGIWVDLVGESPSSGPAMSPPFAGSRMSAPRTGASPTGSGMSGAASTPASTSSSNAQADDEPAEPPLKYDRPEGWRDGRMTAMRMAAFNVGPEDATAELTVIPAGGDLRGNVARWLGQVRENEVPDDVVDDAMSSAEKFKVDGRDAQRFYLTGEDANEGTAIDATIIPVQNGISLFVKMTGPAQTVSEQSEAIADFLKSLQFDL